MKMKTLGEIFLHQSKLIKTADKVAWMRLHDAVGLRWFLRLALSDVEWLLPEGCPPFKADPAPVGISPSNLFRELRVMYMFVKGGGSENLNQLRREQLFQDLLERLDVNETALLIAVKDQKFATKYRCSKAVVNEAFPGLLDAPFTPKYLR